MPVPVQISTPQVLDAMVLVKPATVVQWHRKGVRFYWRWQSSRLGRPKVGTEIRALIRRMSKANPLWGAPRIHPPQGTRLTLVRLTMPRAPNADSE
jgi:hypothetical protein